MWTSGVMISNLRPNVKFLQDVLICYVRILHYFVKMFRSYHIDRHTDRHKYCIVAMMNRKCTKYITLFSFEYQLAPMKNTITARAVLVFVTESKNHVDPCVRSQKKVNNHCLVYWNL